jgi:excisionase family DNA binding protein
MPVMDYRDPDWVAEKLGIDKNTVYKYLQDGTIPALHLGRKWLISEERLADWLASEAESQTRARREAATSAQNLALRMTNYSADAQEVVREAHEEARRYAHDYIGQEHLLLAMSADPDSAAAKILARLGVTADRVRTCFESKVLAGNAAPTARLRRTPRARRAMRLAASLAEEMGSERVGAGHLLLGILESGSGTGFEMLAELGVTLDAAREEVARSVSQPQ